MFTYTICVNVHISVPIICVNVHTCAQHSTVCMDPGLPTSAFHKQRRLSPSTHKIHAHHFYPTSHPPYDKHSRVPLPNAPPLLRSVSKQIYITIILELWRKHLRAAPGAAASVCERARVYSQGNKGLENLGREKGWREFYSWGLGA